MKDPFISRLIVHFVFCMATLRIHRWFGKAETRAMHYMPAVAPPLPSGVVDHVSVVEFIHTIADTLGSSDAFDA